MLGTHYELFGMGNVVFPTKQKKPYVVVRHVKVSLEHVFFVKNAFFGVFIRMLNVGKNVLNLGLYDTFLSNYNTRTHFLALLKPEMNRKYS